MKLSDYRKRFDLILSMKIVDGQKDQMLSGLMTDLERRFNIPMVKNEEWIKENPEIYALYREVSESRSF